MMWSWQLQGIKLFPNALQYSRGIIRQTLGSFAIHLLIKHLCADGLVSKYDSRLKVEK